MKLIRKIVCNRNCGLRWPEAARAALLDRSLSMLMGRVG
jgi:hypothetical protein